MAKWVFLFKLTAKGADQVPDIGGLIDQLKREWSEMSGHEMTECFLTLGEYDLVALAEGEADVAISFALLQAKTGYLATTTMQAFAASKAPGFWSEYWERHDK